MLSNTRTEMHDVWTSEGHDGFFKSKNKTKRNRANRNQGTPLFSSNVCNLESTLGGLGNYGNSTATVKWLSELKVLGPGG